MNWSADDWARLGRALRADRHHLGLSQQELGEQAGTSGRSVQEAEAGKVPKARMPYTVPAIARTLGWPAGKVEEILNGTAALDTLVRSRAEALVLAERLLQLTTEQRAAVLALLDAFDPPH